MQLLTPAHVRTIIARDKRTSTQVIYHRQRSNDNRETRNIRACQATEPRKAEKKRCIALIP
jgi:hypothetical protein